ncbi:uncharacterized protein GIQ15_06565 [Arthroderma uncinatum]|uniref:uncharacterized protein n=1 Tax=Arthroderma uncinatum TaxID=74035 RepID=UPI00144A92CB|nr:uncharacterized protein GIQ15_06565 [Arthroderma uncinatum]KAF3479589.1 hypothetical protein GIQ15_06565 [Arthroderma uncinatum]
MSKLLNLIRPAHITLSDPGNLLQSIVEYGEDPWFRFRGFNNSGHHGHRDRGGANHDTHLISTAPSPRFDVLVLDNMFFLEGEFPGIDKEALDLEIIEPRTLVVRADIQPTDMRREWGLDLERNDTEENQAEEDLAPPPEGDIESQTTNRQPKDVDHKAKKPLIWVGERATGSLQRSFTFPTKMDFSTLRARYANGLLKIMVCRDAGHEEQKRQKAFIEG